MIDNAVPGLLFFILLLFWCVRLTRLVAQRRRSVQGRASKFRYSLPAFVAWSWPAIIGCEVAVPKLPFVVSWLSPFLAPLIGTLLAEVDRPPAEPA